jgi:hypothetical protein
MLRSLSRAIVGLGMLLAAGFVQSAPTLIVDNNFPFNLTGARNVDVGGVLYDVDFRDGACFLLFSGCDQIADFPFLGDAAAAEAASVALLAQVLIDGGTVATAFDSRPEKTAGCGFLSGFFCNILTPVFPSQVFVSVFAAQNIPFVNGDSTFATLQDFSDTTSDDTLTWAVWTLSPSNGAVPEPPTYAGLLLAAGLALAMSRRRNRNRSIQQLA